MSAKTICRGRSEAFCRQCPGDFRDRGIAEQCRKLPPDEGPESSRPKASLFPPARKPSGTLDAVKREAIYESLTDQISDFDKSSEAHESRIRDSLARLSAVEINNLRYRLFAPHYDHHMQAHERAIRILLDQLVRIESMGFAFGPGILGDSILEMSCGTGAVINLLGRAVPRSRAERMKFTANDLSDDMKSIAREKLKLLPSEVEFTSEDISSLALGRKFGTAVLSQTLHLITDEEVVRQERASNYMYLDEKRHLSEKFRVIQNAYDHLEGDGTLMVIDEWPALLSDRGGPLGPGFAYLFNDSLRAIDWVTFQQSIMNHMPRCRFVAHLKVPIDSRHKMHLQVYRKDVDKAPQSSRLPRGDGFDTIRKDVADAVVRCFTATDPQFRESLAPANGEKPWLDLLPMGTGPFLEVSGPRFREMPDSFDEVRIVRCLHTMGNQERTDTLAKAISSLRVGGSLLIVEEWPAPEGSRSPVGKSTLRTGYMDLFAKHVFFAGAIRIPVAPPFTSGMYGYLYRKLF